MFKIFLVVVQKNKVWIQTQYWTENKLIDRC